MGKLADRVAVITGGGGPVSGKPPPPCSSTRGARVVIAGRDAAKLAGVAAELKAGDSLRTIPTDVTQAGAVPVAHRYRDEGVRPRRYPREQRRHQHQGPHYPRTDAGVVGDDDPHEPRRRSTARRRCCRRCSSAKDGVIVNVVSVAGKRANPLGGAATSRPSSAWARLGLVLAAEEKDSGVRQQHLPRRDRHADPGGPPKPVTDEQRALILKPRMWPRRFSSWRACRRGSRFRNWSSSRRRMVVESPLHKLEHHARDVVARALVESKLAQAAGTLLHVGGAGDFVAS